MKNNYATRYGDAWRQLYSPNPVQSAFQPTPPGLPARSAFESPAPSAQPGMFGVPDAEAPPQFDPSGPVSAGQLFENMPAEYREQLAEQIKASGLDVDETYDAQVRAGAAPRPKKQMTRDEKIGYLAEIAMRTLSNLSRPDTLSISDFADAKLATDERRGALERAEQQTRDAAAEKRRVETREERIGREKFAREQAGRMTEAGLRRAGEIQDRKEKTAADELLEGRRHKNALELEALRSKNDRAERAARPQNIVADDGTVYQVLDDGTTRALTVDEEYDIPAAEGKPATKGKRKKPLKARPKVDTSQIDKDTLIREVGKRVEVLKKDTKLARQLRAQGVTDIDAELARRARDAVLAEFALISGSEPAKPGTPATPANPYDQFD